jgi:protein-disulfide isomerase
MDQVLDRRRARAAAAVVLALGLGAFAGCTKKEPPAQAEPAPAANPAPGPVGPEPRLPGVTVELEGELRDAFFRLVERVPSPCGKPESLRKTLESDPECKRGPFAAAFLETLIDIGSTDEEAFQRYAVRYAVKPIEIDASKATRTGPPDAPVKIVEFFDFGCSHCAEAAPEMAKIEAHYGDRVTIAYMDFPIGAWPTSEPAGRAALAAAQQGKWKEYYHALMEAQPEQGEEVLVALAGKVGLDMAKFNAYRASPAAAAQMAYETAQGHKAKLQGRPAIFVNGRLVLGPQRFEWIKSWIDEELAVNR